jgi:hypothetical protein
MTFTLKTPRYQDALEYFLSPMGVLTEREYIAAVSAFENTAACQSARLSDAWHAFGGAFAGALNLAILTRGIRTALLMVIATPFFFLEWFLEQRSAITAAYLNSFYSVLHRDHLKGEQHD